MQPPRSAASAVSETERKARSTARRAPGGLSEKKRPLVIQWTPEREDKLTWLWEKADVFQVAEALDCTPIAAYNKVRLMRLGNGIPRGGESLRACAKRCGVTHQHLVKILAMAQVQTRHSRKSPWTKKPRRRWLWPEDADRAMAVYAESEPLSQAYQRLGVSRSRLFKRLNDEGKILRCGRVMRVNSQEAEKAAAELLATGRRRRRASP